MTDENVAMIDAKPRIKINGEERVDMQSAVLYMRVSLPYSGMSHAEIRMVNWGTINGSGESAYAFQQIAHGDAIEISSGDADLPPLFEGEITGIEEVYGQGAPRLVLLMEDKLHRLTKQRKSRVFDSVSVNDVVQSVLSDADLNGDIQVSSDTGVWHQLNETNMAFLQRILWPYEIAIRCFPSTVMVKPDEEDSEPVEINTQSGLTSLRVIADLNRQYQSAQVKGFNLESDETTEGSDSDSQSEGGKDAKQMLEDLGWGGEDLMAYPFSRNQSEADAWATAAFRKKSSEFLRGDLIISGNAKIKSGKQITLSGASERFNGKYRVVQTQHLFDSSNGYKTRLKITRSNWNPN